MEANESTQAESPYTQPRPAAKRPKLMADSPDWSVRHLSTLVNYPRKRTAMACDVCRVRKTRCDSARPTCASCAHLGVACCYRVGSRPEQDAAETFSKLDSRLERIEALLDQKCGYQAPIADTPTLMPHTPASSYAHAATGSPCPAPSLARESSASNPNQTGILGFDRIGLSFAGFTRLAGHVVPPSLELLQFEEGESYLKCEIEQGRLLYQAGNPAALDLSPRLCWKLQQSFARNILPWFPLFDQEEYFGWAAKSYNHGFNQDDLAKCLILFMLGLGALSKAEDLTSDDPHEFPGLNYFLGACRILNRDPTPRYSLLETQCQILMSLYLLLCLRPLQASHAISVASRSVLTLLNLRSRLDDDVQLRKSCHRAYWVSFVLEQEVNVHVSYRGPLSAIHEAIPLPFSPYNEPGMFWFLAEISMRRLYRYAMESIWKQPCAVYEPKVIEVLRQQVSQWYDGLPLNVKFPRDTAPILDLQRAFLRTQYFGLRWVIYWPAVVRIVTKEPDDEKQHAELLESSSECIHYAIAHALSAETLLQERHQMLFANLLGTYYAVMALLVTYHAPALESVQNPAARAAILKGHAMMSIWAANPGVASNIRRIEEAMVCQGFLATNDPAASSANSAAASLPSVVVHQQGVLSDVSIQRVAGASSGPAVEQGPLVRARMGLEMVMDGGTTTVHANQSIMSGSNAVQHGQQ